ncbi:hypothetical protein [Laceyella putida]|uniref:Uncharacterized protein n=1 Tax=Laceyella putida TaxID=110101 RepID=A0ABW2RK94_9BACL
MRYNGVSLPWKNMRRLILQAYGIGFLVDIIGVLTLSILISSYEAMTGKILDIYFIWNEPTTVLIHLLVVIFCGYLLFRFNHWLAYRAGVEEKVAYRLGLTMGIITAPWLFLVPTSLFSNAV